jgi:hypothetical protein
MFPSMFIADCVGDVPLKFLNSTQTTLCVRRAVRECLYVYSFAVSIQTITSLASSGSTDLVRLLCLNENEALI